MSPRAEKGAQVASERTVKPRQVARKRAVDASQTRMNAGSSPEPRRLRLKLKTVDDVSAELARLYREGKAGTRAVADVSRLGNILNLLGRLIVDNELAGRIEALEEQHSRQNKR